MKSQETTKINRQKSHTIQLLNRSLLAILLSAACITSLMAHEVKTVTLPADSFDGLAAAIAEAGPGGKVIVADGLHQESGTVLISNPVSIIGEPNAVIETATTPTEPNSSPPFAITAALHIQGTHDVAVERIWFRPPPESLSSTAIVIEDSPRVAVRNNRITDLDFGIFVQRGDYAEIEGNRIERIAKHGIVVINGQHAQILGNIITEIGVFGIWACDYNGECKYNSMTQTFIGLILCRVSDNSFEMAGEKMDGAYDSANSWQVAFNEANDNFLGYAVDERAYNNYLFGNAASGNELYDVDFAINSHDNILVQGPFSGPLLIHVCGDNNQVKGSNVTFSEDSCDP